MSSITLSQDTLTSVPGVNLKWAYVAMGTVSEICLIYFENASDANIVSLDIASGATKANIPLGALQSGSAYSFQVQVTDISDNVFYSNTFVMNAPYLLSAPVIASFVGVDAGLNLQLESTSNQLSSADFVDFILKRADNVAFHIYKSFTASGSYQLRSADNGLLVNNQSYRVACKFDAYTKALYTAPSAASNSITCVPTNQPNAPGSVSISSVGYTTLDAKVIWTRPSDFAEWSASGFSIVVKLTSSLGVDQLMTLNTDVLQYTWVNQARGVNYTASVQYVNSYGPGPFVDAPSFATLKCYPDPPTMVSVVSGDGQALVTWAAPSFTGQTAITAYTMYMNTTPIVTVNASTFSFNTTGLTNGTSYAFTARAVNSVGGSYDSNSISTSTSGQMSIVSVVASGKTLTAVISPNGRPIMSVMFLALDQDPAQSVDSGFIVEIPQNQIDQAVSGNITVSKTFSGFSSDINWYACIAHNDVNSAYVKSS
jgi:hypothetical protein